MDNQLIVYFRHMTSLLLTGNNVANLTYWPGGPPQKELDTLLRGPPSAPRLRDPPLLRSPRPPPLLRDGPPPGTIGRSIGPLYSRLTL